jgi:hypothetical protein
VGEGSALKFILIDRRKAIRGKSTHNRQKLLRRLRSFIKNSQPQNIGKGANLGSAPGTNVTSPIKIAGSALEEPFFAYGQGVEETFILAGNDQYNRGDKIEIERGEEGGRGAGPGENGEDDFIINVARDEFLDLFFEDCELPNLKHERFTEKLDPKSQHAGFSKDGNPSQLSVIRSYKQSLGRRWAFAAALEEERQRLEQELKELRERTGTAAHMAEEDIEARIAAIVARLEELELAAEHLDTFEKVDLRYKKKEAKPLHTIESVLIMIMDISGSMGEVEKTIARRWFALLYAFIKRRYSSTDLIFIAHTDEAMEMSEDDFFSTRINGGTKVSPALALANKLITERYDPTQTNIYVSHASDGDNWENDNDAVIDELMKANGLLGKIQLFSYIEVGKQGGNYGFFNLSAVNSRRLSNLWDAYDHCRLRQPVGKMNLSVIETPEDCYQVFKNVFKKRGPK